MLFIKQKFQETRSRTPFGFGSCYSAKARQTRVLLPEQTNNKVFSFSYVLENLELKPQTP